MVWLDLEVVFGVGQRHRTVGVGVGGASKARLPNQEWFLPINLKDRWGMANFGKTVSIIIGVLF